MILKTITKLICKSISFSVDFNVIETFLLQVFHISNFTKKITDHYTKIGDINILSRANYS